MTGAPVEIHGGPRGVIPVRYADPVLDSNFSRTSVVDLPPGSLAGAWIFQRITQDLSGFQGPAGPRTREGTFQAHQEPDRWGVLLVLGVDGGR